MPTLGRVIISIEGEHASFLRSTQQSVQSLTELQRHAAAANGSGGGLLNTLGRGAAIGAAFGIANEVIHATAEGLREVAAAAKEWVVGSIESADNAYKLATALHVPTDSLLGLAAVAKTEANQDFEAFAVTLDKLAANLGEAATAGGPAAQALQRLGLDATKLANQGIDQSFLDIAQAISEVHNVAAQNQAVKDIFGKTGQKLLPAFQEGRAGIEAAVAQAKEFGYALNDLDAAKLSAVKQEGEKLELQFQGVKNQLALALGPVLLEIGQDVTALIPKGESFRTVFVNGLFYIAKANAYVYDGYQLLQRGILQVTDVIVEQGAAALRTFTEIEEAINGVLERVHLPTLDISDLQKASAVAEQFAYVYHAGVVSAINQPLATDKVDSFFAHLLQKADDTAKEMVSHKDNLVAPITHALDEAAKKVDDTLANMAREIATFGQDSNQKKLFELEQTPGIRDDQLATAHAYADELKQLEDRKRLTEDAKRLTEDSLTPLQKYAQEIEHLNELKRADVGLSDDAYANGVAKANEELLGSTKGEAGKKVAAETRRFNFDVPAGRQSGGGGDHIRELAQKQVKAAEEAVKYLAEIYRFQSNADSVSDEVVDF